MEIIVEGPGAHARGPRPYVNTIWSQEGWKMHKFMQFWRNVSQSYKIGQTKPMCNWTFNNHWKNNVFWKRFVERLAEWDNTDNRKYLRQRQSAIKTTFLLKNYRSWWIPFLEVVDFQNKQTIYIMQFWNSKLFRHAQYFTICFNGLLEEQCFCKFWALGPSECYICSFAICASRFPPFAPPYSGASSQVDISLCKISIRIDYYEVRISI